MSTIGQFRGGHRGGQTSARSLDATRVGTAAAGAALAESVKSDTHHATSRGMIPALLSRTRGVRIILGSGSSNFTQSDSRDGSEEAVRQRICSRIDASDRTIANGGNAEPSRPSLNSLARAILSSATPFSIFPDNRCEHIIHRLITLERSSTDLLELSI